MCGRYYLAGLDEFQVEEYLRMISEVQRNVYSQSNGVKVKVSGEVFPTDRVPVIANNKELKPSPYIMKWGYTYKKDSRPIINARSETASEKIMFKDGIAQRRCLVPASHYFEWEKQGSTKIKYSIQPNESDFMFMAGIYRIEQGLPVFAILTRDVAPNISFIHNRMPVILSKDAYDSWLNTSKDADSIINDAVLDVDYKKLG